MPKELKPFGVRVDYKLSQDADGNVTDDVVNDLVFIKLRKRVQDGDDETVGTREFKPASLPAVIQRQLMLYGCSKVLQDRTSDESGEEGRLASMDAVWARFGEGAWEKERESTGRTIRIEVEALARIKGVGVRDIQASLRNYDAEARERILSSDAVKAEVEKMQAEADSRAEETISLDDLA